MKIEEVLHLFTKISDLLPEEGVPHYFYGEGGRIFSGYIRQGKIVALTKDAESFEEAEGVTHWLDLSKLTTKKRSEQFAVKCWTNGFNEGYEWPQGTTTDKWAIDYMDQYISNNKHNL